MYKRVNSVIIKNAIILNILHNNIYYYNIKAMISQFMSHTVIMKHVYTGPY
jgi:hypothetical protein